MERLYSRIYRFLLPAPITDAEAMGVAFSRAHTLYAEIWRKHALSLRFPPGLEADYGRERDTIFRWRVAWGALIGLIGVAAWLMIDYVAGPYLNFPAAWILLGGITAPLLALTALVARYGGRHRVLSPWIVLAASAIASAALLALIADMSIHGLAGTRYPYVALMMALLAVFAVGMMTWRATGLAAAIVIAYAALQFTVASDAELYPAYGMLFLCMMVVLGVAVSWRLEVTDRARFLLSRIVAETAQRDPLTGLLKHEAFVERCTRACREAAREGKPIGFMIANIDHFTSYNKHYGISAGNECLVRVGDVMDEVGRRPFDVAGRLGGAEFGVFWYDMPQKQVELAAERARTAVKRLGIPHAYSDAAPVVTISAGAVGLVPARGQAFRTVLEEADEALRLARSLGRNEVATAPPSM